MPRPKKQKKKPDWDAIKIRFLYNKEDRKSIAKDYGIKPESISNHAWRHDWYKEREALATYADEKAIVEAEGPPSEQRIYQLTMAVVIKALNAYLIDKAGPTDLAILTIVGKSLKKEPVHGATATVNLIQQTRYTDSIPYADPDGNHAGQANPPLAGGDFGPEIGENDGCD